MNALRAIFRRSRLDDEMDEEMQFHLEEQIRLNLEAGMNPKDAALAARRQFGWRDRLREEARDARGWVWIDNIKSDVRYALRSMRRAPGFTLIALTSIALAIGAGTSVYSLVNAILLRSLPVPVPEELRLINWSGTDARLQSYGGQSWKQGNLTRADSVTHPLFLELRKAGTEHAELFGFSKPPEATVRMPQESFTANGAMVSDNFFSGLGLKPSIGRFFSADSDFASGAPNAVISHAWWVQYWALDPGVIGETVGLNGTSYTIVGVLPPEFKGVIPDTEFFVPMVPGSPFLYTDITADWHWYVKLMARMRPGASEGHLTAALNVAFARSAGDRMQEPVIEVSDGHTGVKSREYLRQPLMLMMGAVGLVVLVACANISGLLLARGADREHELAIRAALGAGRIRLIGQVLTETLVLTTIGGVIGIVLAGWGQRFIGQLLIGVDGIQQFDPGLDLRVLAVSAAAVLIAGLLSGLVPAIRAARIDPVAGMQARGVGSTGKAMTGRILVVAQISLSLTLLTGAGLMVRSVTNLTRVDAGFALENRLLVNLNIKGGGLADDQPAQFYEQLLSSIQAIPGVEDTALLEFPLLSGSSSSGGVDGLSGTPSTGDRNTQRLTVSEGFFSTMNVAITRGRPLRATDTIEAAKCIVVNEAFVDEFLPDTNPIGLSFDVWQARWTIVGVCQDIKYSRLRANVRPTTYFPYRQRFYDRYASQHLRRVCVAVRTAADPLALAPTVRKAVARIDPTVAISTITTQIKIRDQGIQRERMLATLGTGLGALGFLLSCIGLYGLIAYNVARRRSEFGIRVALGARSSSIIRPILGEASLLAAAGVAAGLPAIWASNHVIRSQLYGVSPNDPFTLVVVITLLMIVSLFAAWLPARKASRADPMTALRAE